MFVLHVKLVIHYCLEYVFKISIAVHLIQMVSAQHVQLDIF